MDFKWIGSVLSVSKPVEKSWNLPWAETLVPLIREMRIPAEVDEPISLVPQVRALCYALIPTTPRFWGANLDENFEWAGRLFWSLPRLARKERSRTWGTRLQWKVA